MTGIVKLALEAGKATPAPPVGPALGAMGVNIMSFCKEYNAKTAEKSGYIIPVEITVFDVGFSFLYVYIFWVTIHWNFYFSNSFSSQLFVWYCGAFW